MTEEKNEASHEDAKQARPHADLLAELLDSREPKTEREHAAVREIDRLYELLIEIGNYAHDHSTGPAVPDALWTIRGMAYDG